MEKKPEDTIGMVEAPRESSAPQKSNFENHKLTEDDSRLLSEELVREKIEVADFLANEVNHGADLIGYIDRINERKDDFLSRHPGLKGEAQQLADQQKRERIRLSINRYFEMRKIKAATREQLRLLKEEIVSKK